MPLTKCNTCNTEFDATPRCPDCRQVVPDAWATEAVVVIKELYELASTFCRPAGNTTKRVDKLLAKAPK